MKHFAVFQNRYKKTVNSDNQLNKIEDTIWHFF